MGNKSKQGKKVEKVQVPYRIKMAFSLDNLEGVPPNTGAAEITRNWLVKGLITMSEQGGGFLMAQHIQAKRIRDILEECVKTKEEFAVLEAEDFRFLKQCWMDSKKPMQGNEVVVRVYGSLLEAESRRDAEYSRETGESAPEVLEVKGDEELSSPDEAPVM